MLNNLKKSKMDKINQKLTIKRSVSSFRFYYKDLREPPAEIKEEVK